MQMPKKSMDEMFPLMNKGGKGWGGGSYYDEIDGVTVVEISVIEGEKGFTVTDRHIPSRPQKK
jgi:hypothetical protein